MLVNCCLPVQEDGQFHEMLFREEVRRRIKAGIKDVYIFGTAGEGYAINDSLFQKVVEVFKEETAMEDIRAMVGIISLSLQTILDRISYAGKLGFRYFQISLPAWGSLNDEEVSVFFEKVCDSYPEYFFLHYNNRRTKRIITPKEYRILSKKHKNLVATKNGTTDMAFVFGLLTEAVDLMHFFTEHSFAYGSLIGECGFIPSYSTMNIRRAMEYFQAAMMKDKERILSIQREFLYLHQLLMDCVGRGFIDGAYDKIFCRVENPSFPLTLFPPYQRVKEEDYQCFLKRLKESAPQWLA